MVHNFWHVIKEDDTFFRDLTKDFSKHSNENLDKLNCEKVLIQNFFKTYLLEECDSNDDLIKRFGLKNVSNSTVWRWMHHFSFSYDEQKKCYFCDKHENRENIKYRKNYTTIFYSRKKNSPLDSDSKRARYHNGK